MLTIHIIIIIIIHRHRNRIITTNVITIGGSNRATKERQGKGIETRYVTRVGLSLAAKHRKTSSGVRHSAPSRWWTATTEMIIQKQ
jgi:hypothetical protein